MSWISGLQQDVLFTLAAISNLQYVISSILGVDNQKKREREYLTDEDTFSGRFLCFTNYEKNVGSAKQ